MRSWSAAFVDGGSDLVVKLDGRQFDGMTRVTSPVFSGVFPEDNLFDAVCAAYGLGNVPGGRYRPAVDDGRSVELKHLGVGVHTLRIMADNVSAGFSVDVTYTLNIVRH